MRRLRQFNAWSLGRQARAADLGAVIDSCTASGLAHRTYHPVAAGDDKLMIYFHGGGFISGSIDTHDSLCSHLAVALAIPLVSVGYRLAPEYPAPAQLDDALAAWAAIEQEWRAGICGDPLHPGQRRILLGGDSAGAYLAARCALAANQQRRGVVAGLLLLNPLVDIAAARDVLTVPGRLATRYMQRQLGPCAYPSLLSADLGAAPATAMVWGGGLDPIAPGARQLADALERAGIPLRRRIDPALPHGGLNLAGSWPRARRLISHAAADLTELLGAG